MATKQKFDDAARRLLGEAKYAGLLNSGYNRPDFCREIAQDNFIGALKPSVLENSDLDVIRVVAMRLWKGDGVTGLVD